jgi:hypothetical protein
MAFAVTAPVASVPPRNSAPISCAAMKPRPTRRNGKVSRGASVTSTALVIASSPGGNTGGPSTSARRENTSPALSPAMAATAALRPMATSAASNASPVSAGRRRASVMISSVAAHATAPQTPTRHSVCRKFGNPTSALERSLSTSLPMTESSVATTSNTR